MPPSRRMQRESPAGSSHKGVRKFLTKDTVGRRWSAVTLHHLLGFKVKTIRNIVPGVTRGRINAWSTTLLTTGNLNRAQRRPSLPILPQAQLASVQQALTAGGQGTKKHQSLRKAHLRLRSSGVIQQGRETVRRALKRRIGPLNHSSGSCLSQSMQLAPSVLHSLELRSARSVATRHFRTPASSMRVIHARLRLQKRGYREDSLVLSFLVRHLLSALMCTQP